MQKSRFGQLQNFIGDAPGVLKASGGRLPPEPVVSRPYRLRTLRWRIVAGAARRLPWPHKCEARADDRFLFRLSPTRNRSIATHGSKRPWKLYQNSVRALLSLRFASVDGGALEFACRGAAGRGIPEAFAGHSTLRDDGLGPRGGGLELGLPLSVHHTLGGSMLELSPPSESSVVST
jgi:hypothetical protein